MTTTASTGSSQAYTFDEAASPLGCVQQWQWCNSAYPGTSGCGPLASSLDAIIGALPKFNLTQDQMTTDNQGRAKLHTAAGARFNWWIMMLDSLENGIYNIIASLGTKSLASQSSLFSGVQMELGENQWQLDVTNWWNTMLAAYQSAFVETALGEADPELQSVLLVPSNKYEQQACRSQVRQHSNSRRVSSNPSSVRSSTSNTIELTMQLQKIRSTAYASFSVFGLLFTYFTGAIFILISFILDPILDCLHRRKNYKQYEYLEWCTNDKMQLHRLAHSSEAATEHWMKCTKSIPITESGVLLSGLDISDLKVPKIRCSTTEPGKDNSTMEEGDQQSHPQPANVTTVSSEDTLQSPGNVPDTSAEDNSSEPGDGHQSQHESTQQQTDDLGDRHSGDDIESQQAIDTADERAAPDSARLSRTEESGVDTIARAHGSTAD